MIKNFISSVIRVIIFLICVGGLIGCAPTPDNTQVEAAISTALSQEESPPDIEFSNMKVPSCSAGKAMAVVFSADKSLQRGYLIGYDREKRTFVATLDFEKRLDLKEMEYYEQGKQDELITSYHFDFGDSPDAEYKLIYVGESDSLNILKSTFEKEQLADTFPEAVYRQFEVCDLGGDTLVLLVPHYEGLKVWINEIDHQGDMMISGMERARYENGMPIYIYCNFDDKLPEYEIHVSFDELGHFFTTNEKLLK